MKILIYTDFLGHKSGFARMFKDILPYLKKNNEIAHVALGWNGYPLNTRDFKIYHTKLEDIDDYYAHPVLHYALDDFKPDIVLTIQDYWMIYRIAFPLAHPGKWKWFHWGTVDSDPLPYRAREAAKWIHCNLYTSEFGRLEMLQIHSNARGDRIYPSVNPKTFHELDKLKLKKKFHLENHKVIVCTARNQMRKNVPVLLDALKLVLRKIPNACLILASALDPKTEEYKKSGYNIERFIAERELEDNIIFPRTIEGEPIDDKTLNIQYNLADINVLASVGEGFGLPYIEAGICKVPSVAVDCAASREVVMNRGLLVKPAAYQYNQVGGKYYMVKPEDLAEKIIKLLIDDKLRAKMGKNAQDFAKKLTPKSRASKMMGGFKKSIKEDWQPIARG